MRIHLPLILSLLACVQATAQKKDHKESAGTSAEISALLAKHGCSSCHHSARRVVGPAFNEIAKRNYLAETIVEKIAAPQPTNWPGYPPMPSLTVPYEDALKIAEWINSITMNNGTEAAKLR
jgi:cytochrome c